MISEVSGGCRPRGPHGPLDTFRFCAECNGEGQQSPDLTVAQAHSAHWVAKSTRRRGRQGDQVGGCCTDVGEEWSYYNAGGEGGQARDPSLIEEEPSGFAGGLSEGFE